MTRQKALVDLQVEAWGAMTNATIQAFACRCGDVVSVGFSTDFVLAVLERPQDTVVGKPPILVYTTSGGSGGARLLHFYAENNPDGSNQLIKALRDRGAIALASSMEELLLQVAHRPGPPIVVKMAEYQINSTHVPVIDGLWKLGLSMAGLARDADASEQQSD
ncbi:MAG TPA: hypothetical protein VLF59_05345 [Candidatus Saccharimonadales bacterium]|nr:hypothetical protein [Candidatus Saccharimonadales bacterium]